ncbi:hypothetical protein PYW08_006550 [Mythimna loreyi]|uniref:Uncharacterized protein n=1 Tax=Mythimna loreyi TaxID=667449 RepID=A0ACC2QNI3_9NEOP|nr:hypothetical protein PYW08_006550 [Mythimna loreyi]
MYFVYDTPHVSPVTATRYSSVHDLPLSVGGPFALSLHFLNFMITKFRRKRVDVQCPTNVAAIKEFKEETQKKYGKEGMFFEMNDKKVFPLFDTPHLLKGVRNNFINDKCKVLSKWAREMGKMGTPKNVFGNAISSLKCV